MALFERAADGSVDDRVRLQLGNDEVRIAESYTVSVSVLQQPAAFSLRLGRGDKIVELIKKYPAKTPFTLLIGGVKQFVGYTDGFETEGSAGATEFTIKGRDSLAALHDGDVEAEHSLENVSYGDLVKHALSAVGLDPKKLKFDNAANRKIRAGVGVVAIAEPLVGQEIVETSSGQTVKHVMHAKVGETWLDFVDRHIAKAGLFLWAGADGSFILSRPNGKQKPTYRMTRQRGLLRNAVNVIDARYKNETTQRFSECVVYGRGHGKKHHHTKVKGGFIDPEMIAEGYNRRRVFRDANVFTEDQARFYAARKIAERNRQAINLTYRFSGHSAPSLVGGNRAVLTPDTVAEVLDDENGIKANWYLETVEYAESPSITTVTMMRPGDLVFGADS